MESRYIRNFSIIAHIDHGKSTLADRLLELTHTVSPREMMEQVLDTMDLERERGITIKSHAVTMYYTSKDGNNYVLNLIDTPGHVDFTYEVSRSLAACEGAILVVDAVQGVEAQTVSNLYQAIDNNLVIIPIINKIDLPNARIEEVRHQIVELLGCNEEEILTVSAKIGVGIEQILEAIVSRVPPPQGDVNAPLRALIFDSTFDSYRGAVIFVRVFDGTVSVGDHITFFATGKSFEVTELGLLGLKRQPQKALSAGQVGYIISGVKEVADTKVGDTITLTTRPAAEPLPGYKEVKPMVFAGFFPSDSEDYGELKSALERLKLNDASLIFQPESSAALGFGFR
ncbi:elongation factor 4, partial [candidate division KSB1 bacterium 4484_219]